MGSFKKVTKRFLKKQMPVINCSYPPFFQKLFLPQFLQFETHEEKETDVNIAIKIFEYAHKDLFDKAIILSADSDLVPVVKSLLKTFPNKKFKCLLPINSSGKALSKACGSSANILKEHLESALFPPVIQAGREQIICPKEYL